MSILINAVDRVDLQTVIASPDFTATIFCPTNNVSDQCLKGGVALGVRVAAAAAAATVSAGRIGLVTSVSRQPATPPACIRTFGQGTGGEILRCGPQPNCSPPIIRIPPSLTSVGAATCRHSVPH
eukprot:GHUV01018817.1.p3 GENE.GHUV01018817.1~~GHUV01018817.1.p3  ORF type:complete len:125 (-),score=28.13 GHUV01018817.1:1249-1623(-)